MSRDTIISLALMFAAGLAFYIGLAVYGGDDDEHP